MFTKQFLLVLTFFISLQSQAAVWEVKQTWDVAFERKFSEWIKSPAVNLEMALKPRRKYYEQNLDCADLIYYLRAIFSLENKLDFLAFDKNGKAWSPQTDRYDYINDPESRAQAFIKDLLFHTNTATLQRDSVLVDVNRGQIHPGTILLTDRSDSNHAWIIKDVYTSGVLQLISATVTTPATPMIYPSQSFPYGPSVFTREKFLSPARGGFRRFLWPQELRNPQTIKGSLEQTRIPILNFFEEVQSRLAIQAESKSDRINRWLDELCVQMRIRTNIVTDAIWYQRSGSPWTPANMEALSTHSRDRKIKDLIAAILSANQLESEQLNSPIKVKMFQFIFSGANYSSADTESRCLVQWAQKRVEPLSILVQRFSKMQADPRMTLEQRWGVHHVFMQDDVF